VILINLLPHREEARKRRKQVFFASLGMSALVGVLLAGLWYTVLEQLISGQQARNNFLDVEIKKLDAQIKDIATLKAEIEALKARQKAVEDLQTDRNIPVYLLNELTRQTPEGIYLTSIKQADQVVSITGIAQTNERVSEFLRNTLYNSPWLEKPELIEIKAASARDARDPRRLFDFSMKVYIKRPQATTVAQPASAPASAPKKS
jgi:type IV pilus assembly protein PilN